MTTCYIGIDLGTSGVKVIAVAADGAVIASASESFDFDRPRADWAETPPSRWWDATVKATRALTQKLDKKADIASVGLSGQMHGSVFLDSAALERAGSGPIEALRPALMWNDQRTEAERAEIEGLLGGRRASVEASGCPALCGLTAPKLLWLRAHEPDVHDKVAGVCLPKDFIALSLTGVFATDVGEGSGTMLFDNERRDWNGRTLTSLGIDRAVLPAAHESGAIIGAVTAWAATETGLPEGTPLAIGSGDNQAAAVGAGVVTPGEALAILGTSGVVLAPSETSEPDLKGETPGRLNLFCDSTGREGSPGKWMLSGCMLSAAGSLEWARSVLAPGESVEVLVRGAGGVAPGCDGLVFLPYLTGERCPIPDPDARGGWIGLNRSHTRSHLVRAVLEGVSFGLAQITSIVEDVAGRPARLRVTGGGAKSPVWRQILADATGLPVVPLAVDEGSALGAAAMGAHGVGAFSSIGEIAERWVSLVEPTMPQRSPSLDAARDVYDRLYGDLKPAFGALSRVARGDVD